MSLMNVVSPASPASSPSRTNVPAAWRRAVGALRLGTGPLALTGFFLPWATGPGPFAATEFSGFTLVGFAGRLQALDLSVSASATLWAIRLLILGVAITGAWQTVLAPAHHRHFGYPLSGWYLVVSAVALAGIGLVRGGPSVPPVGLGLVIGAGLCFALARALGPGFAGDQPGESGSRATE